MTIQPEHEWITGIKKGTPNNYLAFPLSLYLRDSSSATDERQVRFAPSVSVVDSPGVSRHAVLLPESFTSQSGPPAGLPLRCPCLTRGLSRTSHDTTTCAIALSRLYNKPPWLSIACNWRLPISFLGSRPIALAVFATKPPNTIGLLPGFLEQINLLNHPGWTYRQSPACNLK